MSKVIRELARKQMTHTTKCNLNVAWSLALRSLQSLISIQEAPLWRQSETVSNCQPNSSSSDWENQVAHL